MKGYAAVAKTRHNIFVIPFSDDDDVPVGEELLRQGVAELLAKKQARQGGQEVSEGANFPNNGSGEETSRRVKRVRFVSPQDDLVDVLDRIRDDVEFSDQLAADPSTTLRDYVLSKTEQTAVCDQEIVRNYWKMFNQLGSRTLTFSADELSKQVRNDLATVYNQRATLREQEGRFDLALADYAQALALI